MERLLLGVLMGGLFGFALYYAGASKPRNILAMLRLTDLSLMKIILFAIGLGSVLLSLSAMLGIFDLTHLNIKTVNLGVLIGGLIFGVGFGYGGTCPGTCVAAVGSDGIKKALSAVIGGLTGAFVFSLMYGWFEKLGLFSALNFGKLTLFQITSDNPSVLTVGFSGLLIVGLLFMLGAYLLPIKN